LLPSCGAGGGIAISGIDVLADRPGVGENRTISVDSSVVEEPITLFRTSAYSGVTLRRMVWRGRCLGFQSFRGRRLHPLTRRRRYPDIQFHFADGRRL
jgi:hypothetical protein